MDQQAVSPRRHSLSPRAIQQLSPRQESGSSNTLDVPYLMKGNRESMRWGRSGEIFDETKLNIGSYLDTYEQVSQSSKKTAYSDSTRWGSSGGVYIDDTKLQLGSYLAQEEEARKKIDQEERRRKEETIRALKVKKGLEYLDPDTNMFNLKDLKGGCPQGVDPTKKEMYLSDEDFHAAFDMDYDSFSSLSKFKQQQLKKKAGLF